MVGRVTGVAHTGITVSDLDLALRVFRDVLGASVTEKSFHEEPVMARITGVPDAAMRIGFVQLPGHTLELLQYVRPSERARSTLRPCDIGHMHVSLWVEDLEDVLKRMIEVGFRPAGQIQRLEVEGGLKVVYTVGFDGVLIELMENVSESVPADISRVSSAARR